MGLSGVTVGAGDAVGVAHAHRHAATGKFVLPRLMAVLAGEVETPHVDVDAFDRVVHGSVHVAVLHRVAAPAVEMAAATVGAIRNAHRTRGGQQIDVGNGKAPERIGEPHPTVGHLVGRQYSGEHDR